MGLILSVRDIAKTAKDRLILILESRGLIAALGLGVPYLAQWVVKVDSGLFLQVR